MMPSKFPVTDESSLLQIDSC